MVSDPAPGAGHRPAGPAARAPAPPDGRRRPRRARAWVRRAAVLGLLGLLAVELVLGWPSLTSALSHLRAPHAGWLAGAVAAELASMGMYARMQRRLLLSAGVRVSIRRHVALAYAAHSLSVTLPGGPAFSTRFNYQQMRRFGATPAVASWCIALSGILSATALAVVTAAGVLTANGTPQLLALAALAVAGLLITLGVRQVTHHPERLKPAARAALARVNRIRRRPAAAGLDRLRAFVDQLRAARLTPTHAAAAGTYATLNWLLDAGCLWMCFLAVGGGRIGVTQLLLAFCAGMAAASITIVPGGLGVIDSALILGLVAGGVDTGTAIATVVLYRIISFGFVIGAGWVSWLVIRYRTAHAVPPPTPTLGG
ncbi:membrane protein [Pilimelia terevasa]|uniref:Membrane protein n=1 Tax=Pilimelia terevasa TaxID=53372 RepID=A0A8J3BNJ4_9ACTN|nr:YbhN family protein [Pilimelia terevasa]GGK34110.1 membrane protein [Pilimelia terevasa]